MKRILSLIMVLLLVVALAACGESSEAKTTTTKKRANSIQRAKIEDDYKGQFRVGFSRSDITPADPTVPLSGYGNTPQRIATGFLTRLTTDAMAVSDKDNNTIIIIQIDIINMYSDELANRIFNGLSARTGVPDKNIIFNMSHTHSGPDTGYTGMTSVSLYDDFLIETVIENAVKAMNDRFPSKMYYGETETYHHNFVRHYWADDGAGDVRAVGDNHWDVWYSDIENPKKRYIEHVEEVDPTLYVVKFDREGADDVILTSFRAHNTMTGSSTKYVISADWVGKVRENVEEKYGKCHCMYLQGNAGNVNPSSRMEEENDMYEKDYIQFAETLYPYIEDVLGNMTELKTGKVEGNRFATELESCRDGANLAAAATLVWKYWQQCNDSSQTKRYAYTLGIVSQYAANSYISRSKKTAAPMEMKSSVMVIGELAMTFAPGEMFCALGHQIIEKSPYKYTIPISYSGRTYGYIPTSDAYDYGCYECDTCPQAKGSGEILVDEYCKQLAEIKKNTK